MKSRIKEFSESNDSDIAIIEDYGQMKGVLCVEKLENGEFKFNK